MTDRDQDAESHESRKDEPSAASEKRTGADREQPPADEEKERPDAAEPDTHEGGKGEGRKTDVDRKPEDQRSRPDPKERSSAV